MKNKLLNHWFVFGLSFMIIAGAILASAMFLVSGKENERRVKVVLGGEEILVTIADTPITQTRGLGGYEKLDQNEGMFFIFPVSMHYGFWMKDMRFPIDIIWFNEKYQIVDVWENADPSSYPKVFTPRESALFVLEVPASFFKNNHLKLGNILEIPR